ARAKGTAVLERSVFVALPGAGRWPSALLLDGNIGIGGNPAALLGRVAALLAPDGRLLVELEPPGAGIQAIEARLERGGAAGPWFDWALISVDAIDAVAGPAGFAVTTRWEGGGRWFAQLDRSCAA
ncbi:MAG: SAM-dependent methyltransferase, partial [Acidimicrobiales bacterium]